MSTDALQSFPSNNKMIHRIPRKPPPTYAPSLPKSPVTSQCSLIVSPTQEGENSPPTANEEKREKLVFRKQFRQTRMQQARELMCRSTVIVTVSEMLEERGGAISEPDQGSSGSLAHISTQVPPQSTSPNNRSHRRRSVHKTYQPPTPPRKTRRLSLRGSELSSEGTVVPEMQNLQQIPSRTSFVSIRQSWRTNGSNAQYSVVLNAGRAPSFMSNDASTMSEGVLDTVHEATPHHSSIDMRFRFNKPQRRASLTGDSLLSRRAVCTAFKRLRGFGKSVRTKFTRLVALSLPPSAVKF